MGQGSRSQRLQRCRDQCRRCIRSNPNPCILHLHHDDARLGLVVAELLDRDRGNPQTYLADVLERIVSGQTKVNALSELLPLHWKAKQVQNGTGRMTQPRKRPAPHGSKAMNLESLDAWLENLKPAPKVDGVSRYRSMNVLRLAGGQSNITTARSKGSIPSWLSNGSMRSATSWISDILSTAPSKYAPIFQRPPSETSGCHSAPRKPGKQNKYQKAPRGSRIAYFAPAAGKLYAIRKSQRLHRGSKEPMTQSIVIYRMGSLGDTVVALPCFHKIAQVFPDHHRVVLTNLPVNSKAAPIQAIIKDGGFTHEMIAYPYGTRSPNVLFPS